MPQRLLALWRLVLCRVLAGLQCRALFPALAHLPGQLPVLALLPALRLGPVDRLCLVCLALRCLALRLVVRGLMLPMASAALIPQLEVQEPPRAAPSGLLFQQPAQLGLGRPGLGRPQLQAP